MSEYLLNGKKHPRRFQSHWVKSYPLFEYSEKKILYLIILILAPSNK
jgi:hypothetical protein